jgi:AcrR family transcriptional regulator
MREATANGSAVAPSRRQRSDGRRSRAAILDAAAALSTVEGLDGLSIAALAVHIGMSKSGLFAHFRSKEELQIATVAVANEIVNEQVLLPALRLPTPFERLLALCENYLAYVQNTFPGGCFFASAAAEVSVRPSPLRELIARHHRDWMEDLTRLVAQAQADGAVDSGEDADQVAFELNSYLHLANTAFVLTGNPQAIERGRQAVKRRLSLAASA